MVAISTTSAATKTDGFYGNVSGDIGAHIVGNVVAEGVDGTTVGMVGALSTAGNVDALRRRGHLLLDLHDHGSRRGHRLRQRRSVTGTRNITVEGDVIARGYTECDPGWSTRLAPATSMSAAA